MPKRLARKPSTASLTPAARNSRNAICISPEVIAQITIGTSRMRASVMRLGRLTLVFRGQRLVASRGAKSDDSDLRANTPQAHSHSHPEYSDGQAVAQSAIPKYSSRERTEDGHGRRRPRRGLACAGRDRSSHEQ